MRLRLPRPGWFFVVLSSIATMAGAAGSGGEMEMSAEERAWLAAHPVIRVGCDPDFRPFSFRDAQGVVRGIDAELFAWLGQKLGVRFELSTAANWTAVYDAATRREIDVLSGTADVPERRRHFLFSRPYAKFPVTIVTRSDGPFAVTTSDLQAMRVAGARNYAPTLAFRRAYPSVALAEYDSVERAMEAVARREADAVTTNLANASFIIKTRGFSNLKIAGVVPESFEERLATRSDWPQLAALLDRALGAMPPEELAAILDHWIKVDYAAVIRWDVVRRWAVITTVFALTVIGLMAWRSASLGRELAKRVAVQRALEQANERLNIANAELTQRHDEKTEMMRMAAHDLRSPLTTIMLCSEDLRETHPTARPVETIESGARQMAKLIDNLLEVHALEEGQRVFKEDRIAVDQLVKEVVRELEGLARRKGIVLESPIDRPLADVQADPSALKEVLENLITNAVKFSPSGSTVRVVAFLWGKFVRIEVRDEGPGVPPTEWERIFAKFVRGTARPTGGEKSTGLGLAIVRELVAAMNGRVWCENAPGRGAVFTVVLPRIEQNQPAARTGAPA